MAGGRVRAFLLHSETGNTVALPQLPAGQQEPPYKLSRSRGNTGGGIGNTVGSFVFTVLIEQSARLCQVPQVFTTIGITTDDGNHARRELILSFQDMYLLCFIEGVALWMVLIIVYGIQYIYGQTQQY